MSRTQPMTDQPTPGQLQAWADEAQACVDSGELIITDHEKANATIMVLRSYASLKERIAELEANERAYEKIIGKKTYREMADELAATHQISPETGILSLLRKAGYNTDEVHPECYRNFSYVIFYELCRGLATTPTAALEPFAKAADNYADCQDDRYIDEDATVSVGDLREARAALANTSTDRGGK